MVVKRSPIHPTETFFPLMLRVSGQKAVVVGGSGMAAAKVRSLLEAGADVLVAADDLDSDLHTLVRTGAIRWTGRAFEPADLDGARLVISALADQDENRRIHDEARRRGVLCNVVDAPDLCEFLYPAVVRRGDLVLAISTSGRAPGIAAFLREQLEAEFGDEYGQWIELMGQTRCRLKSVAAIGYEQRRDILRDVFNLPILPLLREGRTAEAERVVDQCVSRWLE